MTWFRRLQQAGVVVMIGAVCMSCLSVTTPDDAEGSDGIHVREVTDTTAMVAWGASESVATAIEYGVTTEYGQRSIVTPVDGGAPLVQTLTDLEPGTTYHFRLTWNDSAGVSAVSADHVLATLPAIEPVMAPAVAGAAIPLPTSIDASGGSDVSGALQRFVDRVPDGSTIVFPAGATYRVDQGLRLASRRDLVFKGNGATIQATGRGNLITSSPFLIERGSQRIQLRDLVLIGNNADAGTSDAFGGGENQMGVAIYGSTDVELANVTVLNVHGDCVYVGAGEERVFSERITVKDSSCTLTGRHGVTLTAATDVIIEGSRFDQIGMSVVDIEPDVEWEGASDVLIRDNSIGSYGLTDRYTSWVLAAEGATGSTVRNVSLIGNTISGGRAGYDGKALGLNVTVRDRGVREGFVVRDNVSTNTVAGPVIQLLGVRGVTITGNVQPLSSGSLANLSGSTGVTYQP